MCTIKTRASPKQLSKISWRYLFTHLFLYLFIVFLIIYSFVDLFSLLLTDFFNYPPRDALSSYRKIEEGRN